jgi:hypothetical protein
MNEQFVGILPEGCHPKSRQIHEYWRSIHPAVGLPGRRHFDPVDIPRLLPNICLIDVPGPQDDFTFRLMGTRLVEFYGADYTGKPFVSAYMKAAESQAYNDLCATWADCLPRWRRGQASFVRNREFVIIERLYLPFANDGTTVNLVLALLLAKYGTRDFI